MIEAMEISPIRQPGHFEGMMRAFRSWLVITAASTFGTAAVGVDAPKSALDRIDGPEMRRQIQVLASDEFEGRGPGTKGEERTVAYLTDQFRRMGLKPGNPDGTFVQEVPLVGIKTRATG